jgi:hypothetical protein
LSRQKHGAFNLKSCASTGCKRAVKQQRQDFCDVHVKGGSKISCRERGVAEGTAGVATSNWAACGELKAIRVRHKQMKRASLSVRVKQRNIRVACREKRNAGLNIT